MAFIEMSFPNFFKFGKCTFLVNSPAPTTAILNLDTASLCEQAQGDFFGYAQEGMIVRGSTSGAQAKINGYRLISDLGANLIFSYSE